MYSIHNVVRNYNIQLNYIRQSLDNLVVKLNYRHLKRIFFLTEQKFMRSRNFFYFHAYYIFMLFVSYFVRMSYKLTSPQYILRDEK